MNMNIPFFFQLEITEAMMRGGQRPQVKYVNVNELKMLRK